MDQNSLRLVKVPNQGNLLPHPCYATSLYTDADNVGVPPTLETLPRELQLQICREMLRSEEPIRFNLCEPYISGFAFGSLGVIRVSKYFSEMALSVMYGENCFRLMAANWTIENKHPQNDDTEDDDLHENDDLEDSDPDDSDPDDSDLGNDHITVSILLVLKRMLVDF